MAAGPAQRTPAITWGPLQVAIGLGIALAAFVATSIIVAILVAIAGSEPTTTDTAVPFDQAREVVEYADERLAAAARGVALPDPPELFADLTTLKIGFAVTLIYEGFLILAAIAASRQTPGQLAATWDFASFRWEDLWRPGVITVVAYAFVVAWGIVATLVDIDILRPESTVPGAITRDSVALASAGVLSCIGAPIAEEVFFRGFVLSGLSRWGFWAAASISSLGFTLAHLDPGSVIPFWIVGMMLAWLYWRRRRLWESIAAHFMFNTTSFLLLALGAV